jgi:hypothetical protein
VTVEPWLREPAPSWLPLPTLDAEDRGEEMDAIIGTKA